MARFRYSAIEQSTGRETAGVLEAATLETAALALKRRGLAPLSVQPDLLNGAAPLRPPGRRPKWQWSRGLRAKDLAVFTRQLGTLTKAGMPLLRSLEVLARQEKQQGSRRVIESLAETIRSGGTLSDGLQQHPRVFDRLYVNMVRAGETGGVLTVVLERLAQFLEKSVRLRGRVKAALLYPLIIVIVAVAIVSALMVFVVPKFELIFATTLKGQSLPLLTQVVINLSTMIKNHFGLTLSGVVGLVVLLKIAAKGQFGVRAWHTLQLRLPLLGDLLRKTAIARFARTLGTLLASGVSILEALRITRDTSGNVRVGEAITLVHDRVKGGESVAGPLRASGIFPDMVPSMIEVGEETGALPEMLVRVADGYDEEVDNSVNALTSLLEPIMIVVMAVMVGTIVIALFLPIVRIIQSLG